MEEKETIQESNEIQQEQNDISHNIKEKSKKANIIIVIVVILAFLLIMSNILRIRGDESNFKDDSENIKGYYIGDILHYEDIDIKVTGIKAQKNENINSDYYGLTELKIYFTYKNNGTKDFDVSTSDIHIETEDKGEKYDCTFFSATQNIADAILGKTIIAGAEKSYDITFYVPYSLEEKKFIMYFDWGILSAEQEYHLYNRDGTNAIIKHDGTDNDPEPDKNEENYRDLFAGVCPVNINVTYYTSDQTLSIRQTNQSGKTIVAIKYLIVVYDAYGEVLQKYGYGASSLTATYDNFNINPGVSNTGDWKLNGFSEGKSLDIYVYSVYYSDNTEWGSHDLDVTNIKNYAPKKHVTGRYA